MNPERPSTRHSLYQGPSKEQLRNKPKLFQVSLRKKKREEVISKYRKSRLEQLSLPLFELPIPEGLFSGFPQETSTTPSQPISPEEIHELVAKVLKQGQNNPEELGRVSFKDFYQGLEKESFFARVRSRSEVVLLEEVLRSQISYSGEDLIRCMELGDVRNQYHRLFFFKAMMVMCDQLPDHDGPKQNVIFYYFLQEPVPELLVEVLDALHSFLQSADDEFLENFSEQQVVQALAAKMVLVVRGQLNTVEKCMIMGIVKILSLLAQKKRASIQEAILYCRVPDLLLYFLQRIEPSKEELEEAYWLINNIVDIHSHDYESIRNVAHFLFAELLTRSPEILTLVDLPFILKQVLECGQELAFDDLSDYPHFIGVVSKTMYLMDLEIQNCSQGNPLEAHYRISNLLYILGYIAEFGTEDHIALLLDQNFAKVLEFCFKYALSHPLTTKEWPEESQCLLTLALSAVQGIVFLEKETQILRFFQKTDLIEQIFQTLVFSPCFKIAPEVHDLIAQIVQNLASVTDEKLMSKLMGLHIFSVPFYLLEQSGESEVALRDCLEAIESLFDFHCDSDLVIELVNQCMNNFVNGRAFYDILVDQFECALGEEQEIAANILAKYFGYTGEDWESNQRLLEMELQRQALTGEAEQRESSLKLQNQLNQASFVI